MTPERWKQVEEYFQLALDVPPSLRENRLAEFCENESIRREVMELFSYHDHEAAVDAPIQLASKIPTALANMIGQTLDGKYKIEQQLGKGGMGSVYRATHLGTGRTVAVKVITPELTLHPEFVERFKREAKAAGRLRHPNIVNVTDFGIAEKEGFQMAYLVMEYLDGFSLTKYLKDNGKLPVEKVFEILEQICPAIDAAHEQGVIHRDLKPDNIWLEPNGRGGLTVKILDFGLAKFRGAAGLLEADELLPAGQDTTPERLREILENRQIPAWTRSPLESGSERLTQLQSAGQTHHAGLTRTGVMMGTPLYMSPEQCRGGQVEAASDIYGLGVITFQMLAGTTPFAGETPKVISGHLYAEPPALAPLCPKLSRPVAAIVMEALAKNPVHRPSTAGSFLTAARLHHEGEHHLAREARHLFRTFFPQLTRVSVQSQGLWVAAACLTGAVLQAGIPFDLPGGWLIQAALWVIPFVCLLIGLEANAGTQTLSVEAIRRNQLTNQPFPEIQLNLKTTPQTMVGSTFKGLLSPSTLLATPVTAFEKITLPNAVTRSRRLLANLNPLALPLWLRQFTLAAGQLALTVLLLGTTHQIFQIFGENPASTFIVKLGVAFLGCLGLGVVFGTPLALTRGLLYFRAREVAGEQLDGGYHKVVELRPLTGNYGQRFRLPALVASTLLMALVLQTTYLLYIPPVGLPPRFDKPVARTVPTGENGWVEYNKALKKVGKTPKDTLDIPVNVTKYASGDAPELTQETQDFLDSNQEAMHHLLAGARFPQLSIPTNWNAADFEPLEPTKNILAFRSLNHIAMANCRRLVKEGKGKEAAELLMASYRLVSAVNQTDESVWTTLIAISGRGAGHTTLFYWYSQGGADAATEATVVKGLAASVTNASTPYQVFQKEYQLAGQNLYKRLMVDPFSTHTSPYGEERLENIVKLFPGLRTRTYQSFVDTNTFLLESFRPNLENWDLSHGDSTQKEIFRNYHWWLTPFPGELAGRFLTQGPQPNWMAAMRSMYRDRAGNAALQALIACSAYNKNHGHFPETLELAMKECGVAVPIDPVTRKPIGYRLENGKPVVWLAGFDGVDNGGQTPYEPATGPMLQPGTDVIFYYGQAHKVW
ncbi:MAG: serine/threonine protein kinase [Blastocatellia bacterium]|nr:serine/threonine protein kinase [Blastocatellia bacterium]